MLDFIPLIAYTSLSNLDGRDVCFVSTNTEQPLMWL